MPDPLSYHTTVWIPSSEYNDSERVWIVCLLWMNREGDGEKEDGSHYEFVRTRQLPILFELPIMYILYGQEDGVGIEEH